MAAATPTAGPLTVHSLDELTARALGIAGCGAVLVGHDGVPVGLWPGDALAAGELRRAVAAVATPASRGASLTSCAA